MEIIVMIAIGVSALFLMMSIGAGLTKLLEEQKYEVIRLNRSLRLSINIALSEVSSKLNSALNTSFDTSVEDIMYLKGNSKGVFNELDGVAVFYNKKTDLSTFVSSEHLFNTIFNIVEGKDSYYIDIHEQYKINEELFLKIIPTGYSEFNSGYEMLSAITNVLGHVNTFTDDSGNEDYVIRRTKPSDIYDFEMIIKLSGVSPIIKEVEKEVIPIKKEENDDISRIRAEARRRAEAETEAKKANEDRDDGEVVFENLEELQEEVEKTRRKSYKRRTPLIELMKEKENSASKNENSVDEVVNISSDGDSTEHSTEDNDNEINNSKESEIVGAKESEVTGDEKAPNKGKLEDLDKESSKKSSSK